VVLHLDAVDSAVEELGVVAALLAQVEDPELVRVLGRKEALHLEERVAVARLGALGGEGHGDARGRDVGEVQVEAVLRVARLFGGHGAAH